MEIKRIFLCVASVGVTIMLLWTLKFVLSGSSLAVPHITTSEDPAKLHEVSRRRFEPCSKFHMMCAF
jgi:hypothetical protein